MLLRKEEGCWICKTAMYKPVIKIIPSDTTAIKENRKIVDKKNWIVIASLEKLIEDSSSI
jgi:hypothetical protein